MTEEKKLRLFEQMLNLEQMAEGTTYDGRDYFEQAEGAFKMLEILGIGREYIRWSLERF